MRGGHGLQPLGFYRLHPIGRLPGLCAGFLFSGLNAIPCLIQRPPDLLQLPLGDVPTVFGLHGDFADSIRRAASLFRHAPGGLRIRQSRIQLLPGVRRIRPGLVGAPPGLVPLLPRLLHLLLGLVHRLFTPFLGLLATLKSHPFRFLGSLGRFPGLVPRSFRRLHCVSRNLQVEQGLIAGPVGFSNTGAGILFGGRDLGAGLRFRARNARPGLLLHGGNARSRFLFHGLDMHRRRETGFFRCIKRLL